jgi:hypothetical protein
MVSWMRLVAALVACACISGCQKQPDLSALGSPSQRLVGHWITNNGTHEYFGPVDASGTGSFVVVNADAPPGLRALQQQYRVLSEDAATQTLHVGLMTRDAGEGGPTIVLSEDGQAASATDADGKTKLAWVRMDDAVAPTPSRAAEAAATATTARAQVRPASASFPRGRPKPPANLPDGEYHRVLVRYDGLKPVYKWEPLTARDKTPIGVMFSPSHAVAQRHSYLVWLHATAAAILLITTLLFAGELGATALLAGWTVALAIGGIGVFLLHVPLLAGVLEIVVGGVLVFKAMFQKSDLLS